MDDVAQPVSPTAGAGASSKFDWRELLGALSSLAPLLGQNRASNSALDELARGRSDLYQQQKKADLAIGDAINAHTDEQANAAAKARQTADYAAAVRKARTGGNASVVPTLGGDRFQADTAALTGAGAAYGDRTAQQYAAIDAPALQRQAEAAATMRAGSAVDRARSAASSSDFITRLRAANAARVSPWTGPLAALGSKIAGNWQTADERPKPDGLQPINLSLLPKRRPAPAPVPLMQPFPDYPEG